MVSKSLKVWLKGLKPEFHFRIQSSSEMVDTYQNVTHPIHANVNAYLKAFQSLHIFSNSAHKPYHSDWKFLDEKVGNLLNQFISEKPWSEPSAMQRVLDSLPENSLLQLGNSSTVRWASWLGFSGKGIQVYSNRGTSGIDGTLSTAIGSAQIQNKKIVTLILGDLSLFYDQNAFWQNGLPNNLRVIVINNNGGNIFNWIDGPDGHPNEIEYFTTPHQLSIAKLCDQHGLTHLVCEKKIELASHLDSLYEPSEMPVILELKFDNKINLEVIKEFRKIKRSN
jgi:2-succinyl-5-enolpyruvyl-6-hydroxy-3-cyclohexene-1-carboxylate synthase